MKSNLYVYSKPNQMVGHEYNDDVAITYSNSIEEALEKFSKYYTVCKEDIRLIIFHSDVAILTDY